MKKLLLAAVAVVSLTACSRNNGTDEIAPEPVSPILGTWRYEIAKVISGADGSVIHEIHPGKCSKKDNIEFRAEGVRIDREFLTLSGGECKPVEDEESRYEYNSTAKILKHIYLGDEDGYEVEVFLLDANNLGLVKWRYDKDGDGVTDKEVLFYVRQN